LAQVVLKRLEKQKETYLCFVDLRKAYDSVWREGLFQKLETDGVPQKLVRLVRMWYETVRAKVRVNDVESEWFETKVGVKQGDTLSPLLFNIFINGIVERVKSRGGGARVGDQKISILLFADNMVLLAESEEELKDLMAAVEEYCKEWHLEVNVDKTKVMVTSKEGDKSAKVVYDQAELECVKSYTYLGTVFTADGKWEEEVERRIKAGRAALGSISKQVVWNKFVSVGVKKVIFNAMVKSRLMYGGDIWWASKSEVGRIETVQNDFIRWVTGHTRKERISTDKLRKEVNMGTVEDSLCCKRLDWLGRLTRMGGDRLVGRVWGAQCEGKRGRGRPRWIYEQQEAEDLARGGIHRLLALDVKEWNRAVRRIKEPQ
jgi:sorting nexin-29